MRKRPFDPDLPATFREFVARFPELETAHETIARSIENTGPLDRRTCELIKMGLSIGAGLQTATLSHARRALQAGASRGEVEQAVLLTMNTCGFPRMVAAWKWAGLDGKSRSPRRRTGKPRRR